MASDNQPSSESIPTTATETSSRSLHSSESRSPPPAGGHSETSAEPGPEQAKRNSEALAAIEATLTSVSTQIDQESKGRTIDLHANSAAISKQEAEIKKQTRALEKQAAKWEKALSKGTKELNELGDLQNWAEVLERDLLVLEEVVRLKEGAVSNERR